MVERIIVGPMNTNAYIFSEWKKECIVVDPGGDIETLISHIGIKSMKPRGILLTHGHIDHIAACAGLVTYFADQELNLPIAIHEADAHFLGPDALNAHRDCISDLGDIDDDLFETLFKPIPSADLFLKEGDAPFESSLVTIHTPGHTPGSVCFYSENQGFLLSGDTLFFEGIGRTDLSGGDTGQLIGSIKKKLLELPEETRVFPGHGPFTTIERESDHNPFLTGTGSVPLG